MRVTGLESLPGKVEFTTTLLLSKGEVDDAGGRMNVRDWSLGAVLTMGLLLVSRAPVSAAGPPTDTLAGTGGGCAANGGAISGAAGASGSFGEMVRVAASIVDEDASSVAVRRGGR